MFEQTFLEKRRRNPWATLLSFAIDSLLVGALILLPLLSTGAAPTLLRAFALEAPPGPPPGPPEPPAVQQRGPQPQLQSDFDDGFLVLPRSIPERIAEHVVDASPSEGPGLPSGMTVIGGMPGGTGSGGPGIMDIVGKTPRYVQPPPQPEPKPEAVKRVTVVSTLQQARAIFQPEPVYPQIAKIARVSGRVRLAAVISEQGTIEELRVLDGPALLVQAAVDAVRQWRYRPLLLGGKPTKVDTTIDVYFTLR